MEETLQMNGHAVYAPHASAQLLQAQQMIGSFTGKLLRDNFGKGPESVYVSIGYTYISIYLRNFMTPSERVLYDRKREPIVLQMRDSMMETLLPEIRSYVGEVAGVMPDELYYDWNLPSRTGMIAGICREPFPAAPSAAPTYTGKELVEREMAAISSYVQKAPERLVSYEINARTVIVVRSGILVRVEKELIRLGHGHLLKSVKRNLEKDALRRSGWLEEAMRKKVVDTFVDWSFDRDTCVTLFVLSPKPKGADEQAEPVK